MNYKHVLSKAAHRVANKFDVINDVPLVVIGGSVGDPLGYVSSTSDIDLLVWTSNIDYLTREPAIDWQPYKFKKRSRQREGEIDVVTGIDGKYDASVLFRLFDAEQMRKDIENLANRPDITRTELDNYIENFVESQPCKDEVGLYDLGRSASIRTFSGQRSRLAREKLGGLNLKILKISDDRKLSLQNEPIDLKGYNYRTINVLNGMTYILCCARNLARSYIGIAKRRNNKLWEHLGIDRDMINATMPASEQVEQSFYALKGFVLESCDSAEKDLPGLEKELAIVRKHLG